MADVTLRVLRARLVVVFHAPSRVMFHAPSRVMFHALSRIVFLAPSRDAVTAHLGSAADLLAAKFMTVARSSADVLLVCFALVTLATLFALMVL